MLRHGVPDQGINTQRLIANASLTKCTEMQYEAKASTSTSDPLYLYDFKGDHLDESTSRWTTDSTWEFDTVH